MQGRTANVLGKKNSPTDHHKLSLIGRRVDIFWESDSPTLVDPNITSWWLNQPIWKIGSSNLFTFPNRGENKTYLKPPPRLLLTSICVLNLLFPMNQSSYSQMMRSRGGPFITETKCIVFRFHETILSFGEVFGSLGFIYSFFELLPILFIKQLFIKPFRIFLLKKKSSLPWAPKTMKNKGFGHLKTRWFTIKTSKNVGFRGPWLFHTTLVH